MAQPYKKVIAFDIGIKNLAYCILENKTQVLALENCNILEPVTHNICHKCSLKASYHAQHVLCCKRHLPKTHPILPELDAKKVPNKVLKELVKTHQCENLGTTNEKCLESLAKKFALRVEQPKQISASKVSLEEVHDSLRKFVSAKWPILSGCTHVLLENQPAFKNPHMKSVQVLLFAVLREAYLQHQETPEYHFIHAKKKVMDAEKGDGGYKERKQKSEEQVLSLFESGEIRNDVLFEEWKKAKKKSDMADAVCMAFCTF
jgi:hypothetical protein